MSFARYGFNINSENSEEQAKNSYNPQRTGAEQVRATKNRCRIGTIIPKNRYKHLRTGAACKTRVQEQTNG